MNATELIRSYVSRIERLEAEIAALNGDKAEIYVEAKSKGIDVPTLKALIGERRKKSKDPNKYDEQQGLLDIYRDALDNGVVVEHARAPARARAKITETDHAATSSVPEGPADLGKPPRPDPVQKSEAHPTQASVPDAGNKAAIVAVVASDTLPQSPADAQPQSAADCDPAAACALPHAVSAGDADADWERHDGAATFFLGHAVAGGKEPHPGECDTDKTKAVVAQLIANNEQARHERLVVAPDLSRMSETELVERALSHRPKHMGGAV